MRVQWRSNDLGAPGGTVSGEEELREGRSGSGRAGHRHQGQRRELRGAHRGQSKKTAFTLKAHGTLRVGEKLTSVVYEVR